MFKFFAKKYVIGKINELLKSLKDKEAVITWKARIQKILAFLQKIMQVLDDNEVSEDEASEVITEAKKLFE